MRPQPIPVAAQLRRRDNGPRVRGHQRVGRAYDVQPGAVVDIELGGGLAAGSETGQTVTVVFSAPFDRTGAVVKVAEATDELKG